MIKLAVSPGDPAGIGPDICIKAFGQNKNLNFTLLELKPITGRKHQIRKQLLNIGHPVVGDKKYSLDLFKKSNNKNLMLHSYKIKFMVNGDKINYKAPIPSYFKKFLESKKIKLLNN